MKKTLILILAVIFCTVNTISCKRIVDYNYPTTFVYENSTSHTINVRIVSYYTPMSFTLEPSGTFSDLWDIGFGPAPFEIREAEIRFDDKYSVFHRISDENTRHNICDIENYTSKTDPEHSHGSIITYTFTEEDYQYAVSHSEE